MYWPLTTVRRKGSCPGQVGHRVLTPCAGGCVHYRKHFLREAASYGPELPPEMAAKLKEDSKEILKNEDLPCLMWDEMVDDPDNPDMAAMQALLYDEMDATERAESFKVRCKQGRWPKPS